MSITDDDAMNGSSSPRAGGPSRRRSFTPAQRLEHLAGYEAACVRSEGGAYLRRNGLYSSLISKWRRRDSGVLAGKEPGAKVGRPSADQAEIARLRRQLAERERRLAGLYMTRFPTPGHLASWAKFAPGVKSSAGKSRGNGSTGHGNRYLARVLGEAAVAAARTDTFLGARYRRIARRRGKKKAIVAVGRSLLVIIWHLLADPEARFEDLGSDYYERHVDTTTRKRNHVRALESLGYRVTIEPAA